MASLYQRGKKGTWWIKYYVRGRPVFKSLKTTSARAAERVLKQIEGEHASGSLMAPSKIPLPEFLQDFCEFLKTIRTRKSYKNDFSVLRVFFGPICPALQLGSRVNRRWRHGDARPVKDTKVAIHVRADYLEEITGGVIETFVTKRIADDKVTPKTVNRCREVLHRMFNYAAKTWEFVSPDRRHHNPAAIVQRRHEPPPTIRFLSAEQIDEQLNALANTPHIQALVATYIYAGLRREEALWLTPDDVDLKQRVIRVRAKTIDGEFWQPKTRRNRVVPISGALLEVLTEHRPPAESQWFFPSPQGVRWDPDNFSHDLRDRNQEHGLVWSCLDFRHTFGSHLAQKGESLYKIAELMGNSPEICRRHYAALIPEKMHDVVEFDGPVNGSQTEALLREILDRVSTLSEPKKPELKVVRCDWAAGGSSSPAA